MSNKKKRFARKNKPSTQLGGVHSGLFEKMLPNIKAYILRAINSLEQRTNNLKIMIEEVKGNVVALTSVLEKTKMIRREDYMKEFIQKQRGIVQFLKRIWIIFMIVF